MDDKKKLDEEIQEVPKRGSGSLLAAARKKQNRTVEEIADELNLSATQIRTIELDQSEGLPEPTYVRGYIRSYARLLGLDVDDVLDHYLNPNWQKGTRLDDMPRGIGSAGESESSGFFTPGKVVFMILFAAIIGFLWFSGKLDSFLKPQASVTVAAPASNSVDSALDTVVESTANNVGEVLSTGGVEGEGSELTDPDSVANEESEAQPLTGENQLTLTFSDTSWVDIRDGDGNRLAYKSYAQGEDLVVKAGTPMSVFLGNAKAVSATLNGSSYDISQYREGAYARFTIGE